MEESNSNYGKRRRNVLIVGVVIVILYAGNPNLSELKLFDMEFNFKGRVWMIWLGITIWFLYVIYRAYTYYHTYLKPRVIGDKRSFIYGTRNEYWQSIVEEAKKELESHAKETIKEKGYNTNFTIQNFQEDYIGFEQSIRGGNIPGSILIKFKWDIKNVAKQTIGQDSFYQEIEFKPNRKMRWFYFKRRLKYFFHDDWGEHILLILFSSFAFTLLVIKWFELF